MNASDRAMRDAEILELHHQRVPQNIIAAKFKLGATRVRRILRSHGIAPLVERTNDAGQKQTVWDRTDDPNRLRLAIWKRASQGARAALADMMGKAR